MMEKKKISQEEFDLALFEYVREAYDKNPAWMLEIPGVYEIVSEYLNNEVIEYIEEKRQEQAEAEAAGEQEWPTD